MIALCQRFPAGDAGPESKNDWLLWQLADSAFPTGGFAHSGGLEAAWQHGQLRNRLELAAFLETSLCQFGRGSLPFMTSACDHPDDFPQLDRLCENFTANHVANRASRLQGQALLASAQRIFARPELLQTQARYGHWAPVFGIIARGLAIGHEPASRLFFFLHLRGLLAAAVRLGIVGPFEAQSLQHQLTPQIEAVLERCQDLSTAEIAQTAPLHDLWQGTQDRLYSRLFQS